MSTTDLIEAIWGDDPPRRASDGLRVHIHHLRRLVGGERLSHRGDGYQLDVDAEGLDAHEFDRLTAAAKASGDPQRSRETLRHALALFRGPAYADVDDVAMLRIEAAAIGEKRLAAYEECFEAELTLGLHAEICGELRNLANQHPYRERLKGQLMLALYRSHRQADALAAFEATRRRLARELGVDPSRQLRDLHERMLHDDPTLAYMTGRAAPSPGDETPTLPPPASDASRPPSQLPAAPADFTGRLEYIDKLDRVVKAGDAAGTVVITALAGMAGIGKTALATYWASAVRDRFPDGQLYVNLRGYALTPPLRPIDAIALLLRALDLPPDRIPIDLDEAIGLYRTTLSRRRLLLLLDNARNADQVRPLLPAAPGSLALVTSRDRLSGLVAHDGATRITLDVLDPDESHALLRRMLGDDLVDSEPDAVAALATACGHLPLALRIAAANLLDGRYLTVAAYVHALHSDHSLGELEVDDDSQSSVRTTFSLSYQTLEPEARRLFRLLSVAPGPDLGTEAVAAIAATTVKESTILLDRLARAHLVGQSTHGRWSMHDLVRAFARERALTDEPDESLAGAEARLYEWFLRHVNAAAALRYPHTVRLMPVAGTPDEFRDPVAAKAWLDTEETNLAEAVRHAAEKPGSPVAWLLADGLRGYFRETRDRVSRLAVAQCALGAAERAGDLRAQAATLRGIGDAYAESGQIDRAIRCLTQGVGAARRVAWTEGEAGLLNSLGTVYTDSGRQEAAIECHRQALERYRSTGRTVGQAVALSNVAYQLLRTGRLREAAGSLADALALQLPGEGGRSRGITSVNLGFVHHYLGEFATSELHLLQALETFTALADTLGLVFAYGGLAALYSDMGQYDRAFQKIEAAMVLHHQPDDQRNDSELLIVLAALQYRCGDGLVALVTYRRALRAARAARARYYETDALIGLSRAADYVGDTATSLTAAREALCMTRRDGHRVLEGEALTALAAAHLQNRFRHASTLAKRAASIQVDTGFRLGAARANLVLAHAQRLAAQPESASAAEQQAASILAELSAPAGIHIRAHGTA